MGVDRKLKQIYWLSEDRLGGSKRARELMSLILLTMTW
jgi:hypothetical protein